MASNFNPVTMSMLGVGGLLIYSAVSGKSPKQAITDALGPHVPATTKNGLPKHPITDPTWGGSGGGGSWGPAPKVPKSKQWGR